MSAMLELGVEQETTVEGVRRHLILAEHGCSGFLDKHCYFIDLPGATQRPMPQTLDAFVFGILFLAMQRGKPLVVKGALSRQGFYNIMELQRVWSSWKPGKYRLVEVLPSAIVDVPRHATHKALSAYSGGVDGTFTALRHGMQQLGNASYPLTDALLVHGFDVPLDTPEHFNRLAAKVSPFLSEIGLNLHTVRTNLKEASGQDWDDSYVAQLACCLHQFSDEFDTFLIGSGGPYKSLIFPEGSTPVADRLYSTDYANLVLDGLDCSRTEKIAFLGKYPHSIEQLHVCWEENLGDKNCGHCEKCVRTKMNFLATGIMTPSCFNEGLDPDAALKIPILNQGQLDELQSVLQYAQKEGINGEWIDNLTYRLLAHHKKPNIMRKIGRRIHQIKQRLMPKKRGSSDV